MTDRSPPRTPSGQIGAGHISRIPQMPGLDGMRALAVVAVMIYHADAAWLHGGFLGVEVFFVISGYLITLLLINEHERSGRIDLRQFWLRRFRRLLPALFVMLGLLAIYVTVAYATARGRTRGDILGGLSYVSNWYQIWVGAGYTATEAFAPLRHLWSLAVEEQFYLVWPLVMALILRRGHGRLPRVALWLWGVAWLITLATALLYVPGDIDSTCAPDRMHGWWRIGGRCVSINDALYLGTFSRASGLLLGAALAIVWRPAAIMRSPLRRRGHVLDAVGLLGLVVLGWLMWNVHLADPARTILTGSRFDPLLFRGGLLITGLATVLLIMAVSHAGAWMGRLLGNPLFGWIGTRSYGLYLYHWPVYQIIRKEAGRALEPWELVLALAITLPLTELSYRIVEIPIRQGRIGAWLREQHRRPSPAVARRRRAFAALGLASVVALGFAGVSIAMAPNRCIGAVECASDEGAELIAGQDDGGVVPIDAIDPVLESAPPADPGGASTSTPGPEVAAGIDGGAHADVANPAADPAADPATTAVATTSPPSGSTAPTAPTTPTASSPTSSPSSPSPSPSPSAASSPSSSALPPIAVGESVMLGAVPELQAAGFTVYAAVAKQGTWVADVIGQLRAGGKIGDTIVIQTGTNGPVSAETYQRIMSYLPAAEVPNVVFLTVSAPRGYITENNTHIRALAEQHPNVRIADWETIAASVPLCGDEVHVSCGGGAARAYANVIFGALGRTDLIR